MATRANIIIKQRGKQVIIYHHWDGYPEWLGLNLLETFTEYFKKHQITDLECAVNLLLKNKDDDGYDWSWGLHSDIEYLYEIDLDKRTITCSAVNNWEGLKYKRKIDLKQIKKEQEQKANETVTEL